MPHTDETFYKMKCGWAEDEKVAALARFGPVDAVLARDLFGQMIDYSRRNLTDGWVPAEMLGRLVYPLAAADADRLALQLADPGPYGPLCEPHSPEHPPGNTPGNTPGIGPRAGYRVLAYARWNDTRAEVEARTEHGRKAALRRWDRGGDAPGNAAGMPRASASPEQSSRHTEQEQERETPLVPPAASNAPGMAPPPDDDDLIDRITAVMAGLGRAVTREGAEAIRAGILGGRAVEAPGPYVLAAIRRDPGAATLLAEGGARARGRPSPDPIADVKARTPPNPDAPDHARAGAARARELLEETGRRMEARQDEARARHAQTRALTAAAVAELPLDPADPPDEYPF